MGELRFDGRTAIITGGGGNPSLGRAHALLLAARGANVVVNDIGRDPESPDYIGTASAEVVVAEIRAFGGKAVADTHSVATEAGATAIIQTALDAFGGVDILVNNAAICIVASLDEMSLRDIQRHIDINLLGPLWTCRAAWPHMRAKGYGRIINITSASMTSASHQAPYAATKGGVLSLSRALAAEGKALGIKVNAVNPGGFTRMVTASHKESSAWYKFSKENLPPELVSPVVAYLAHETCPVSGECIEAMAGRISRVYFAQTPGFTDRHPTIETVAKRWNDVLAETSESVIGLGTYDPKDWDMKPYIAN